MSWHSSKGGSMKVVKTNSRKRSYRGRVATMVFLGVLAVASYVWSINRTAIQGYAVRSIEKEIAEARAENQKLRIAEAELRSLERIEAVKDHLNLVDIAGGASDVSYIESPSPLALR